jgi:spore germination protein GerM
LRPVVGNAIAALGLFAFWSLLTFTAPRWARYFREPLPTRPGEDASATEPGPSAPDKQPEAEAQRRISVKLFFEAPDRRGLVIEDRSVPFSSDLTQQIRVLVEELIRGSQTGLLAPFGPGTRVLQVFVTARGVAYVDLSKEVSDEQPGGSDAELMSVYSLVNSVTANFPAVRRVQLLVDDRPAPTLAGHVDLSRPLPSDMTLMAPAPVSEASPSPAPSPAS